MKGGEDVVVQMEHDLLSESHHVKLFTLSNKAGIKGAIQFICSICNLTVVYKLKKIVDEFNPDIIHIHNFHFSLGPFIIRFFKYLGIPVILTLHNYRLLCPSGTLFNKNRLFLRSINQVFPYSAILNKVYRNSFFETLWTAIIFWFHNLIGTWNLVDKFVVLTNHQKDMFINSKLNIIHSKFFVKPNFITSIGELSNCRDDYFLYVGRLSSEKGIQLLLEAFKNNNLKLVIIGDGPLKNEVTEACNSNNNISYLGHLNRNVILDYLSKCSALIFPSIWFEPFGLVLIEALSQGCPIIASDSGSPSEIIINNYNGLHFETNNLISLKETILYWNELNSSRKMTFYSNAYASFQENYTPELNLEQLNLLYRSCILPSI